MEGTPSVRNTFLTRLLAIGNYSGRTVLILRWLTSIRSVETPWFGCIYRIGIQVRIHYREAIGEE